MQTIKGLGVRKKSLILKPPEVILLVNRGTQEIQFDLGKKEQSILRDLLDPPPQEMQSTRIDLMSKFQMN
jgi:hypothetical protein